MHIFLNVRISKSSEKGIKLRISRKPYLFHLLFLLFSQILYLLKLNINKHTFIHIFRKTIYAKPIWTIWGPNNPWIRQLRCVTRHWKALHTVTNFYLRLRPHGKQKKRENKSSLSWSLYHQLSASRNPVKINQAVLEISRQK